MEILSGSNGATTGSTSSVTRLTIEGEQTASQVLSHTREALARSEGHPPTPPATRPPVGFSYLAHEATSIAAAANRFSSSSASFEELCLSCVASDTDIAYALSYDPRRFSGATIERMANQYRALLAAFADRPTAPVRSLPMLSDGEQRALLRTWSGPAVDEAPLVFLEIERRAAERPDDRAVSLDSASLTYAELNRAANQLARWLRDREIGAGANVAVCMEPCLDFIVCMLGIFKAGATHLPLDPGYPSDRLTVILDDTRPAIVLTQRPLVPKLEPLGARLICFEEAGSDLAGYSHDNPGYHVSSDQIAFIVYTSGTTGKPKGVLITHGNLAHYIAVARGAYGYKRTDVIPAVARYTFSITFFELLCPLASGARLVLLERNQVLDLRRMVGLLEEATCLHASPSLWRKLLAYIDEQQLDVARFGGLRHVSSGGDMVPADVVESLKRIFRNADVFIIYGCSEVSCMACSYPVPRDRTLASTRVGRPFPNMTLRLLDPDRNLVPPGIVGEVWFGGAGLAAGYLNAPELTARKFARFHGERLYNTGDLGRVDDDGNLELLGRSDFQIKLRGIRIEPAEVEANLRRIPGVKDTIVAAPVLSDGEKRLVAYVVRDPAAPPSARTMRDALRAKLPDYMVPASYVFLDALPVNVNNKVDRLALQKATGLHLSAAADPDPPRNAVERRLVEIWERVLDVKGIGIHDDFFDIGGDSLRSVALMSAIDREMGFALPVSTLLTDPTVERLAAVITGWGSDSASSPLVCLRPGNGSLPPIFFVHDGDGETMPYRNLALRLAPGHTVYGIRPKGDHRHPMLHTRLTDIVDDYIAQIRSVQATGPYFVGGLCIGGFLAFEIGRKLRSLGELVGPIALMDVAHVTTPPRSMTADRIGRFSSLFQEGGEGPALQRVRAIAKTIARRTVNMVQYETRARYERNKNKLKLLTMRYCLDRGARLPDFVRDISVDATLRFAEKEYVLPAPYQGEVLLFRATCRDPSLDGVVNDTPYMETFEDPMLGWENKASVLKTYDIPAGHSSMLREPNVRLLATTLQARIDSTLVPTPQKHQTKDRATG